MKFEITVSFLLFMAATAFIKWYGGFERGDDYVMGSGILDALVYCLVWIIPTLLIFLIL